MGRNNFAKMASAGSRVLADVQQARSAMVLGVNGMGLVEHGGMET